MYTAISYRARNRCLVSLKSSRPGTDKQAMTQRSYTAPMPPTCDVVYSTKVWKCAPLSHPLPQRPGKSVGRETTFPVALTYDPVRCLGKLYAKGQPPSMLENKPIQNRHSHVGSRITLTRPFECSWKLYGRSKVLKATRPPREKECTA